MRLHQLLNINRVTTLLHCFVLQMSQMSDYYLLMLLTNLQIKLRSSVVTYVSVIQFSIYSVNFIVLFRRIAKILLLMVF